MLTVVHMSVDRGVAGCDWQSTRCTTQCWHEASLI